MKILVVDDDAKERENIISILDDRDKNTFMEADTKSIELNLLGNMNPDVAIIDLNIGGNLHGISLLKKMKDYKPETKIILLVSELMPEEFYISEELGVDGYIFKDIEANDIRYVYNLIKVSEKFKQPLIIGYMQKMN
ncbi:MAG: response regulator [Clostridiales bacterium]